MQPKLLCCLNIKTGCFNSQEQHDLFVRLQNLKLLKIHNNTYNLQTDIQCVQKCKVVQMAVSSS